MPGFPEFTAFLGVDQTGAATHGGTRAKPLPVAWLEKDGAGWRLHSRGVEEHDRARSNGRATHGRSRALTLPALNPTGLASLAIQLGHEALPGSLALMVDCVFGLP